MPLLPIVPASLGFLLQWGGEQTWNQLTQDSHTCQLPPLTRSQAFPDCDRPIYSALTHRLEKIVENLVWGYMYVWGSHYLEPPFDVQCRQATGCFHILCRGQESCLAHGLHVASYPGFPRRSVCGYEASLQVLISLSQNQVTSHNLRSTHAFNIDHALFMLDPVSHSTSTNIKHSDVLKTFPKSVLGCRDGHAFKQGVGIWRPSLHPA